MADRHRSPPERASSVPLLMVVLFLAFADNFAQFPVLPGYARHLGATPLMAGVVLGVYSLTNVAGNLWIGRHLDRWGYRLPLLVSLAASGIILAIYGFVQNPSALIAVRATHGLAAAALLPAIFAWRAAAGGDLLQGMGRFGAVIGLAAVAVPPLSGSLAASVGYTSLYLGLGGLFLMTALLVWLGTRTQPPGNGREPTAANPLGSVVNNLQVRYIWFAGGVLVFGVSSLALNLPLDLAEQAWEAPSRLAGLLLAVFAVAASAVMLGSPRSGNAPSSERAYAHRAGWGFVIQALALIMVPLAPGLPGLGAAMAIFGAGFGLSFPALQAVIAAAVPSGRHGAAFAVFYACFSIGAFLGPVVSGAVGGLGGSAVGAYLPGSLLAVAAVAGLFRQAS